MEPLIIRLVLYESTCFSFARTVLDVLFSDIFNGPASSSIINRFIANRRMMTSVVLQAFLIELLYIRE